MKKIRFLLVFIFMLFLIGCDNSKKSYTISFDSNGGSAVEAIKTDGKSVLNIPGDPVLNGYEFAGWYWDNDTFNNKVNKDSLVDNAIKGDVTVYAKYNLKNYEIKYYEGPTLLNLTPNSYTILQEVNLPTVVKAGYEFAGWYDNQELSGTPITKVVVGTTNNKEFYAKYELVDYGLKFYDGSTLLDLTPNSYTVLQEVNLPNATKADHEFAGWYDNEALSGTPVTKIVVGTIGDKAFYAKFTSNVEMFTVTFNDSDDNLLKTEEVEKNKNATPPTPPTKVGYDFDGWDKDYTNVTANITVTTKYNIINYDIKFYDGSTLLDLQPKTYTVEDVVNFPTPEKEGYDFVAWYDSSALVNRVVNLYPGTTGNKAFYAKWEEIEVPDEFVMPVGAFTFSLRSGDVYDCVLGAGAPTTSRTSYNWSSSDATIVRISSYSTVTPVAPGFAIITATYINDTSQKGYLLVKVEGTTVREATAEEVNQKTYYTVTFKDDLGNVIDTQEVLKGMNAELPTPPTKAGHLFFGWDNSHVNIQQATTLKASYIAGNKSFEGKKVTIIGDSTSTYYGYMPSGFSYFYPYPTSGVGDVNQMWWMQIINKFGMSLLVNNSYSGSTLKSLNGNQNAAEADKRLGYSHVGDEKPDYIFIFMGLNDIRAGVTAASYKAAYINMISKLKVSYPNAEIVLCTITTGPFTTGYDAAGYNNAVKEVAAANNFAVFDFEAAINANNYNGAICDSVHPSLEGMNRLAAQAINDFLDFHDITKP